MAAWLERASRRRGRRQEGHRPLLTACCCCVRGIAQRPIKVPPAHAHGRTALVTAASHAESLAPSWRRLLFFFSFFSLFSFL